MTAIWIMGVVILVLLFLWWAFQPKQGQRAANAPRSTQNHNQPRGSRPAINPPASLSWPSLEAEVQEIVAQGHKILAIKRVREQTGWGLKKAKNYVETLPPLAKGSSTTAPETSASSETHDSPIDTAAEVRKLVINGQKITAIKRVREQTGWGLREAKAYVETLMLTGGEPSISQSRSQSIPTPEAPDLERQNLLTSHRKLEAIKRLRETTGMSLAEAKASVEEMMRSRD